MAGLDSARFECGQRGARPVDVVDAPTAEPGAVGLLLAQQPVDPAAHLVVEAGLGRHRLERVRADVGARLVGHLAEVAERQLVEPVGLVVPSEGPPAPAAAPHPGRPGEAAPTAAVPAVAAGKRERNPRRAVAARVEVVLELERPAARRELGLADRPVAGDGDLFVDEPVGRSHERRVLRPQAGLAQGEHGEAGVPNGRLARLRPQALAVIDREAVPALDRAAQRLVLEAVAEGGQQQDRPDPRWLDPAPRTVRLLVSAHPALGLAQRGAAQRPRRRGPAGLTRPRADLAQVDLGLAHGTQRAAGGERDKRAACPAGEVVDRERRARREEHQLDRDRRHPLPGPLAEQGEEALGEDPRLRDPAARADELTRLRAGVDARELQRRVRLDRGREVTRAVEPDRPGSVVTLTRQQLAGDLAIELRGAQAQDVVPEEVLRGHGLVRLQLAAPVAVRGLELERAAGRGVDRRVEAGLGRDAPAATSARAAVSARAAASPLRIAPSIVAGQPGPGHAPPRVAFRRFVRGPGRRGSLPGGTPSLAAGSRLTRDQSSSASPRRPVSSPAIRSTSSRPRSSISWGAPEETTVRYCPRAGDEPVSAPRSKTQCASLPSSAASGEASSSRSNQRWTLTIGESSRCGSGAPSRRALSRRRTATTNAAPSRPPGRPTPGVVSTRAPPASSARPAASPCMSPSGRAGRSRSESLRSPSSAVRTVKSPAATLASAQRRFSAGRMKTSQKRSIARCDWPRARSASANVSPPASPQRASARMIRSRSPSETCR